MKSLKEGEQVLLGQGTFALPVDRPTQTFKLFSSYQEFSYVKFSFLNNHNNPDYTCIYRLRVHGFPIVADRVFE